MKMYYLRLMASWCLLCFCMLAHADASSDLSTMLNAVRTMQANFTQTVYDNRGKAIQKSYGRMAMQRPGKFRWQLIKPLPQLIIANQSRLWIVDPDLEQVTIRVLHQATGETPALLLSHENSMLDNDFNVKEMQKKTPGWRWFDLTPKKADSVFASVQMGFVANQIREMRLQDHLGHTTTVQFDNIKSNATLSPSLFTYKPPANMDVIDETRQKRG
jgi:outer membrane lipoprotein carrier protein